MFCECASRAQNNCGNQQSWEFSGSNGGANHCYAGGERVPAGAPGQTEVTTVVGGCGNLFRQPVTCILVLNVGGGKGVCACSNPIGGAKQFGQLDSTTCRGCFGV